MDLIDLEFLSNFNKKNCLIIGEIAQAHDGSLGTAHAYIDAIAHSGVDAVKFQTHIASSESTPDEPWRVKFSPQDHTRYDYWKRMEFTEEQWMGLKEHAVDKGLIFLSSPFSTDAFDLLSRVGVSAWKIASGEITNTILLDRMLESKLPILLSTGMSPFEEIDHIFMKIRGSGNPHALLQCTSMYPAPPERIGLNLIQIFRERYGCPTGLSDHSGKIFPGLAAVSLGAVILEVHVTFSKETFGPDVMASVTTPELAQLVEGVRFIEKMLANPVNKGMIAEDLKPMRNLFTKSVVANKDLQKGTRLTKEMLGLKKPGTGIHPDRLEELIGKSIIKDIPKDAQIKETDVE